ncbi:MAG: hypothetical protein AAGC67_03480 [Myxococcota bacterium]
MTFVVPLLIFALLAAPAVRLLVLAARTRQAPEVWGGLYFLGTSIGIPLRVLGHALAPTDPGMALTCNAVGHVFFAAAVCALTMFTWRVFRPDAAWARGLALGLLASIVAATVHLFTTGTVSAERSIGMLATNATRLAPLLWAFAESLRYRRAMRRRAALGLADPIVTNRFLLWTLWTGALAALPAMTLSLRVLKHVGEALGLYVGEDLSQEPLVVLAVRVVFLLTAPIGAVALSLSFFPPERYLAAVRARAEAADEAPVGAERGLGAS